MQLLDIDDMYWIENMAADMVRVWCAILVTGRHFVSDVPQPFHPSPSLLPDILSSFLSSPLSCGTQPTTVISLHALWQQLCEYLLLIILCKDVSFNSTSCALAHRPSPMAHGHLRDRAAGGKTPMAHGHQRDRAAGGEEEEVVTRKCEDSLSCLLSPE